MDGEAPGQSLATEHGGVFATLGEKEEAGEKNAVRKLVRRQIQFMKLQKDTVTYCSRSRPSFSTEIEFLKSVQEKKTTTRQKYFKNSQVTQVRGSTNAECISAVAKITFPKHSLDSPGSGVKCRAWR